MWQEFLRVWRIGPLTRIAITIRTVGMLAAIAVVVILSMHSLGYLDDWEFDRLFDRFFPRAVVVVIMGIVAKIFAQRREGK